MSILRRLFGSPGRNDRAELLHIPENLRCPSAVAVVQGSSPGDIWAALHALRDLEASYPGLEVFCFVRDEDRDLVQLAGGAPVICPVTAGGRVAAGSPVMPPGGLAVLAAADPGRSEGEILAASGALLRATLHPVDGANVTVKAADMALPDSVHFLFDRLGLVSDRTWRPSPLRDDLSGARMLLAPSSGSPPPYIVAGKEALRVLERAGAEIPLRVVLADGKGSDLASAGRAVRAAAIACASLVAADTAGLWAEACAFHVHAAGLDRRGRFPSWTGYMPSRDEAGFLASWADHLRAGFGTETPR